MILKFPLIIEPDGDRFHGFCPALRGVHVEGQTEDEVIHHLRDAILAYLDSLKKHNDPLPVACIVREPRPFWTWFKGLFGSTHRKEHELLLPA